MNVTPNDFPRFPKRLTFLAAVAVIIFGFANSSSGAVGTVIACGNNNDLQSQVPPALLNVEKVAAGALHSAALKHDSTVVCWGSNSFGQTNVPPNLTNVVAVSADATFSLALKSDGSLVQWGSLLSEVPVMTNAIAIATVWDHALTLQADGMVIS